MRVDEPIIERISIKDMHRYFMASGFPIKINFFLSYDFILQLIG
jgi:hypothetical protein